VEGRADLEHDGALGSGLFAEIGGSLDCGGSTGDDGLVGGVEVGGGDDGAVGREAFGDWADGERGEIIGDLRPWRLRQRGRPAACIGHGRGQYGLHR